MSPDHDGHSRRNPPGAEADEEEAGDALRMAAAVKLSEFGRLSSGAAARLAGIPRVLFLSRLDNYGVDTFRLTKEDLQKEAS